MTAPAPAPPSVRVAAGTLLATGVLLTASTVLTLVGQDTVVDQYLAAQPDLDRAAVTRSLVLGQVLYLVLGLLAAVAPVFLLRRRPWARWTGVAVALFVGLRTVLSSLTAGGTTISSLLVLVLCVAAVASLLARSTREWLPARAA
ncbi:hypothetical protein [Klenkia sp. PcliD-1-E]|uniref:hypothetical protein n=1 Tax=Klenkia sp. PcliD-1-E TaxID=2954492 RepID=UPI00209681B4|nr:hypothetical protein [Klenkia sp. PcliD-1-E]MCO7218853.1 hypothetical protein [Klenkia sp. PcliD-1-E]